MAEKFILMDLNDKRSKKVAEVLKSEKCKNILDYLGEIDEASEKDISDALDMKLNTVEYNLKKVVSAGLVDKSKNFFWSKKGKKIVMYKLAKKHIIISPKKDKINPALLKNILPVLIGVAVFVLIASIMIFQSPTEIQKNNLNQFKSFKEIENFIEENTIIKPSTWDYIEGGLQMFKGGVVMEASMAAESSDGETSDYSETNIQVEGVDEADIIKNDGKYIYMISGNKIIILNAFPAEDMEILSEFKFEERPIEMLINEDKLIVFFSEYNKIYAKTSEPFVESLCILGSRCPGSNYQEQKVRIIIYDIENRSSPKELNNFSISGNYFSSRMIGDYVYVISNQYLYDDIVLPYLEEDGKVRTMQVEDIYYADIKDHSFQNTIIASINLDNSDLDAKSILTGRTQEVFVSQDNIYTTFTKHPNWYSELGDFEETIIQKINIDEGQINPFEGGSVPGHLLNQFSMDEYEGKFRVATTVGNMFNQKDPSINNLYVLDEEMKTIGKLEGLAPGENIYSVRFMGKRAYVVTFKKVDPLFVIDLETPENPKILGKLKIPGYSDYLHPYDETHIIGIGKEAVDASNELIDARNLDFAWYQGVKMAIFDVSDVENPIEMHKVVIGDRGTESEALRNHKAFLFDREKELLVLPISLAEIQGTPTSSNQYGEQVFQGSFVFNINLEDGFVEKGRITHYSKEDILKMGSRFYGSKNVKRNLYIDDVLYSISEGMVKANSLDNLDEISSVEIKVENSYPKYYY